MALTTENKALMDLDHMESILKFGHHYEKAQEGTEQYFAFRLGKENRIKINKMISEIKTLSIAVDGNIDPMKVFELVTNLMQNGDSMKNFFEGTIEKYAYNMKKEDRDMVLNMIKIIRDFNPYQ